MTENNIPAATPDNPGQVPGQAQPANTPAAEKPQGENNGGQKIEMDPKEVEALKRDAGRWAAYQKNAREERRNNRGGKPQEYQNLDGAAPEVLEALRSRDTKLDELSLANRELAVKDRVRDLMDSDDYKDVPVTIKKAIIRNPLGFVNRASESLDDAVADIQDYLDEELDRPSGHPAPEVKVEHPAPPISGSGPAAPNAHQEIDVTGKTGPARSTAILQNLLKNRGK